MTAALVGASRSRCVCLQVLAGAHGQLYSSINNQFQFEKAASAPGPFVLIVDRNTSPAKMRLQLYDLAKKEVRFQTDLFQGMVIQKAYQKDAPNFYHFTTVVSVFGSRARCHAVLTGSMAFQGGAPQGISFSDESEVGQLALRWMIVASCLTSRCWFLQG